MRFRRRLLWRDMRCFAIRPSLGYCHADRDESRNAGIPNANAPNIIAKSHTITADIDVPEGGGDGMLVTQGRRWGGF